MSRLYIAIFLICSYNGIAQISEFLFSPAGGKVKNNNIYIEYALGEVLIGNYRNNLMVTEGLIQPITYIINETNENERKILVYPNPTAATIIIEKENNDEHKVELIDAKGNIIMSEVINSQIDLSNLNPGFYFIRIYNCKSTQIFNKKILKI
jgi:hypothetical protein